MAERIKLGLRQRFWDWFMPDPLIEHERRLIEEQINAVTLANAARQQEIADEEEERQSKLRHDQNLRNLELAEAKRAAAKKAEDEDRKEEALTKWRSIATWRCPSASYRNTSTYLIVTLAENRRKERFVFTNTIFKQNGEVYTKLTHDAAIQQVKYHPVYTGVIKPWEDGVLSTEELLKVEDETIQIAGEARLRAKKEEK